MSIKAGSSLLALSAIVTAVVVGATALNTELGSDRPDAPIASKTSCDRPGPEPGDSNQWYRRVASAALAEAACPLAASTDRPRLAPGRTFDAALAAALWPTRERADS